MDSEITFKRVAGISALVAAPVATLGLVLASLAVDLKADFTLQDYITLGDRGAAYFRTTWMVSDAFGYAIRDCPVRC